MNKLILITWLFAQPIMALDIKAATEKYQFKASTIKAAVVHNSTGNVNIAPITTPTAFVVLNKIKWGPRCSANVDLKEGILTVETDDKAWILDHECRVDLILSLPHEIPLQVRSGTGDIQILATRSDIDVKMGSGLISLKGEINNLKALLGSGDLRLEGQTQTADIKTGSGDIEMDLTKAPNKGRLALKTGSGDVELYLPETSNVKTQISAGNGTVNNEFTLSQSAERVDIKAASATGNINIRKK